MAAAALLALFCFPGPVAFAASPWTVPPPGSCQPEDGLKGWPPGQDAPPVPFQPGDAFDLEQLAALKDYFPPQLWAERERFFYEG
ncbi:MAG: hypothetical protein O7A09_02075, partial [Proteobacteria bacterium]|nr:hypothetical protein [Pseudomonadota bacterium]